MPTGSIFDVILTSKLIKRINIRVGEKMKIFRERNVYKTLDGIILLTFKLQYIILGNIFYTYKVFFFKRMFDINIRLCINIYILVIYTLVLVDKLLI